ncbi:hypothetical protein [Brochothrix thermosphacta]|uniref:hypothetical protein n=1 Tax=Brochothrix thermosphacta TaxID=2756 RepID=UPI00083FCB78|nr:hypothetical protein [Brochothrix thermosphacta]ODJ60242.1 hypothetical protein BFR44_04175 [Brochothrix thermosphacta]SLM97591.1 hypothetical protein FM106_14465 [Brachybacterium faecium]
MKKQRLSFLLIGIVTIQVIAIYLGSNNSLVRLPLHQQFFVNLFGDNYINLIMPALFMWLISYHLSLIHLTHMQQWFIMRGGYFAYYRKLLSKALKLISVYILLVDVFGFICLIVVTLGNRVEHVKESIFSALPSFGAVLYLIASQFLSLLFLALLVLIMTLIVNYQWEAVIYPYLVYAIVPIPLTYALDIWPERYIPLTYYETLVMGNEPDSVLHYFGQLGVLCLFCLLLASIYFMFAKLKIKKGSD